MKTISVGQNYFAKVSDLDFKYLNQFTWHVNKTSSKTLYAETNIKLDSGKWTTTSMHRLVARRMGISAVRIDHRNRDGLDNRRKNIRGATYAQNRTNTGLLATNKSGYAGVFWEKSANKWRAQITHKGKKHHLGLFDSEVDAAYTYRKVERELRAEFAGALNG